MAKQYESDFGYARVYDGLGKVYDSTEEHFGKRRRRLTKAQFVAEWNKLDEAGRRRLMETTIPVLT